MVSCFINHTETHTVYAFENDYLVADFIIYDLTHGFCPFKSKPPLGHIISHI